MLRELPNAVTSFLAKSADDESTFSESRLFINHVLVCRMAADSLGVVASGGDCRVESAKAGLKIGHCDDEEFIHLSLPSEKIAEYMHVLYSILTSRSSTSGIQVPAKKPLKPLKAAGAAPWNTAVLPSSML